MSFYVYILTNAANTTLNAGVTNNLKRRVAQHRQATGGVFTTKYRAWKLVHFETFESAEYAIQREKQIKAGPRRRKIKSL